MKFLHFLVGIIESQLIVSWDLILYIWIYSSTIQIEPKLGMNLEVEHPKPTSQMGKHYMMMSSGSQWIDHPSTIILAGKPNHHY